MTWVTFSIKMPPFPRERRPRLHLIRENKDIKATDNMGETEKFHKKVYFGGKAYYSYVLDSHAMTHL
jgi:hypothetical protein